MPEHEKPKQREWQDIARDASRETNPEKLRYLTDELSAVMDSRREYFQHKNENAQSSPPRLRGHVLRPLRWILERARKRHAA
jgi:hypothetical protein